MAQTLRNSQLDSAEVRQARLDLAACFRMAHRLGLHEGICNHFSLVVPGRDDLMLVTDQAKLIRMPIQLREGGDLQDEGLFVRSRASAGLRLFKVAEHEHVVSAARIRLRPILMTSFAFIFGVLPLAIATGAGANSRIAIGTSVIGGMLTATLLAIFYIPLLFVLVRRGTRDGLGVLRRRFGRRPRSEAVA